MADRSFLVDNFHYRLATYYPRARIQRGFGCVTPSLVVVQDQLGPDADATVFVLRHMGLLRHTFIAPLNAVPDIDVEDQLYYLRELVDILKPITTVAAGHDIVALLRDKDPEGFKMARYRGREFESRDLKREVFPVYPPVDYVDTRADRRVKQHSKHDWLRVKTDLMRAKTQEIMNHWSCSEERAIIEMKKFFGISS